MIFGSHLFEINRNIKITSIDINWLIRRLHFKILNIIKKPTAVYEKTYKWKTSPLEFDLFVCYIDRKWPYYQSYYKMIAFYRMAERENLFH